ncbi:hypothetical protein [Yinghuangia seranimata]|uniref:hypothetical protein n=1 Tax=Yinghuangia seranimata TaxID=408067 RepID=UPI00248AE555|nr:hypothetical protein [Yinghuangia seranimata]MDI2131671.1 hypothetical protein [Yinghuangia seranimata]
MDEIDTELVGIVLGAAKRDVSAALIARLGAEFKESAKKARKGGTSPMDAILDRLARQAAAQRAAERADEASGGHGATKAEARPRVIADLPPAPPRPEALSPADLAGRADLTADELRTLLDLDEPAVDARLFVNPAVPDEERVRMVAGIRRDGGTGPVGAPLLDLLWSADIRRLTKWLPFCVASGDLKVATAVVSRLELRTEAGRLRIAVAVWERGGPDAARRLRSAAGFPDDTDALLGEALDAADGLALLRARLAEEADPAALLDHLLHLVDPAWREVQDLTREGTVLPWDALVAAHERGEVTRPLYQTLAWHADCPRPLLLGMLGAELSLDDSELAVADALLVRGAVSPDDVLTLARPAANALLVLAGTDHRDRRARWHADTPRADLPALFAAALGTDTEAWAVAMRLLPDFAGSVPELLSTASATVAGPPAG